MTAIAPRGWCPTLRAPMASGDGLLVRLRPPRGVVTAAAARALAEAAAVSGNGIVELTQRMAIQVRGLRPDTLAPFAAAMEAAGLAAPEEPGCDVLRAPLDDVDALADAIAAAIARVPGLPQKFCIAVEGRGPVALGDLGADIRVASDGVRARVALAQSAPCKTVLATRQGDDDAAGVVVSLARAFLALSAARTPPPRRMRTLVAEIGAEAVFGAAGLAADAAWPSAPSPIPVGRIGVAAFGLGLRFGAFDGAALADLATRHGDGALRLAPRRAVVIAGVGAPRALATEAAARGLIVDADDPRSRLVACPGAPACASATVATRGIGAMARVAGTVHVSGCAKGCAHPGRAALTLVGRAGRYDLVRHGCAGDAPCAIGLTLAEAMTAA